LESSCRAKKRIFDINSLLLLVAGRKIICFF
jgi:hypothetical protein